MEASAGIESAQLRCEVNMHPVAMPPACIDRIANEARTDASSLPCRIYRCIDQEEVNPAVPSDVHEPHKVFASVRCYPGEATFEHGPEVTLALAPRSFEEALQVFFVHGSATRKQNWGIHVSTLSHEHDAREQARSA